MTWDWAIVGYVWIAGLAGGAYFVAFLADRFSSGKHKELVQWATYMGVPLILLGCLFSLLELGKPLRAWHLFLSASPESWHVIPGWGVASSKTWPFRLSFHPISPMSTGSWLLLLWTVIGLALIALWFSERAHAQERGGGLWGQALSWIAFVLAVLIIVYPGVLLTATNRPLWAGVLFLPALLVASDIVTGTAAMILILALRRKTIPAGFSKSVAILILIQAVVLIGYLVTSPAGVLISGSFRLAFWVGVVLVGMVVPFFLELKSLRTKASETLILSSTLCILAGGAIMRMVVVWGGQM